MRKLSSILFILSLVLMMGLVSAQEYSDDIDSFPDQTATYGQDATISLQCPDSKCPVPSSSYGGGSPGMSLNIEGCIARQGFDFAYRDSSSYMDVTYSIPSEYSCGIGEHDMQVMYDGNVQAEATLDVQAKNMDPHKGQYLYIVSDINNDELQDFILSNDIWEDTFSPFWGDKEDPESYPCVTLPGGDGCYNSAVMVEDVDDWSGNEYASWNVDYGERIEPSTSDSIESIVNGSVYEGKERYTGGTVGDGDCANDPCALGKASFTTENGIIGLQYGKYARNLNSSTPVETGVGVRMPEGEVIFGEEPVAYDKDGERFVDDHEIQPTRKFFICREGATMDNGFGSEVPQVVDVNPDLDEESLMQCQQTTSTWQPVAECNDELDNDNDTDIDYPDDTGCNSETDSSESGSACETGVTRETIHDPLGYTYQGIVAQYETSSGCSTDGTIYYDDDIVASNLDYDPGYTTCEKGTAYFGGPCTEKSWDYNGFNSSTMPIVKYWPTWNYFYQMENADENLDLSEDVYQTDFVTDYVGWDSKVQSLYDAEKKYSYGSCIYGLCQEYYTWEDRIKMPEVEEAYNNSDSDTNIKAWHHNDPEGPYNAGANNTRVLSKDSSSEAVFKGGFAGKCENDEVWQYKADESEWKCSGDIDWQQTVYLPEFQNDDNAGLIFPPYNFINDKSSLPDYIFNKSALDVQLGAGWNSFETAWEEAPHKTGTVDVQSIDAKCWNGTKGLTKDQVKESENYIESNFNVNVTQWFTINVPDNPSDPVAEYKPLTHDGTYSCAWRVNAETSSGTTITEWDAQDFMVEMHNHLGKSSPSGTAETVVKNITEDSSYAGSLPDATGSDHDWTSNELEQAMNNWN